MPRRTRGRERSCSTMHIEMMVRLACIATLCHHFLCIIKNKWERAFTLKPGREGTVSTNPNVNVWHNLSVHSEICKCVHKCANTYFPNCNWYVTQPVKADAYRGV